MKRALLVLAAGMGSRYGGLKQIEPVGPGGETIIDYSVYDALRAGFDKLVFVIRRDIEKEFREAIGRRFEPRVAVEYVFQELDCVPPGFANPPGRRKPWGTAHAILMAAEAIHGPFGVINGDDFYGANSFRLLGAHLSAPNPGHALVGFVLRQTLSDFGSVARGVCRVTPDGFLQSVTEITGIERDGSGARSRDAGGAGQSLTGDEIVSMNMWGFMPGFFGHLERQWTDFLKRQGQDEKAEFYIPVAVTALGDADRVKVLRTPDAWLGVTYREDRPLVAAGIGRLIERGDYPKILWPQT